MVARHQEEREASCSGRGLLRTRQREGDLEADIRSEELLAENPPVVAVAFCNDGVESDIRPTLPLGHPLSRRPGGSSITGDEVAQRVLGWPAALAIREHPGGAIGHGDRT